MSLSKVKLHNREEIRNALVDLHRGKSQWVTMGYAARDEIKYLKSGTGLDNLRAEYPENDVKFAMVSQVVPEEGGDITKYILVTMVGDRCQAIKRARSAAHRTELGEFCIQFAPVTCQFQGNDKDEICAEEFFSKLRVDPSARAKWKRQQGEHFDKVESGTSKIPPVNFGKQGAVQENIERHRQQAEIVARKKAKFSAAAY